MMFGTKKPIAIGRKVASYEEALLVCDVVVRRGGTVLGVTVFGQTFKVPNPKWERKHTGPKHITRTGTVFAVFAVVRGEKAKRLVDADLSGAVADLQAIAEEASKKA